MLIFAIFANFGLLRKTVSFLYNLAFNKNLELKKQKDNSFNLLILGTGGGDHDGPDLTDTIIFANVHPEKNAVNLVSIPRDLWVPQLERKINAAYEIGKKKENKGIFFANKVMENVIGEETDYTLVIDFSGFVRFIDYIGGIDVGIKNSFDDYAYPIVGKENDLCGRNENSLPLFSTASSELEAFPCRYEHISFQKGTRHMSGETALKFVRSRHSIGLEGTDFARSKRQQEVILAVKEKVLSMGIILNPVKIFGIYNILKDSIDTNITLDEVDDFIRLAQKMKDAKINNFVIDRGDEEAKRPGLLLNPPISDEFGGQWVLLPRIGNGDFSEIRSYIKCLQKDPACSVSQAPEDYLQVGSQ